MLRTALIAAAILASGSAALAQKTDPVTAAKIRNGLALAQQQVPDAQLLKGRIEMKNGLTIYGFYFWTENGIAEIEIGSDTKIVKKVIPTKKEPIEKEAVSEDVLKSLQKHKEARTKLPEGRLLQIAADQLKDSPLSEVKYDVKEGKLVMVVGNLVIDAETGKVLSQK